MTTKDIRTSHAHTVCDVCGRTLLRGERAETYINGGARREVCELCKPRALHEGWVREGTLPDYDQSRSGSDRRRSLFGRLRRRDVSSRSSRNRSTLDDELADRSWEPSWEPPPAPVRAARHEPPAYEPAADYEPPESEWDEPLDGATQAYDTEDFLDEPLDDLQDGPLDDPLGEPLDAPELRDLPRDTRRYSTPPSEDEQPRRRPWSRRPRSLQDSEDSILDRPPQRARSAPFSASRSGQASERRVVGREPRHVRAVPSSQEQKMVAAVKIFNQSEHRRTVAGVAKSLGGASVTVLPAAEPHSLVHIVVCWELCWYRYAVDLSDHVPGVRVDGQGYELSELSDTERAANAVADESGQLILR